MRVHQFRVCLDCGLRCGEALIFRGACGVIYEPLETFCVLAGLEEKGVALFVCIERDLG